MRHLQLLFLAVALCLAGCENSVETDQTLCEGASLVQTTGKVSVGDILPSFAVYTEEERQIPSSGLRGEFTLLYFQHVEKPEADKRNGPVVLADDEVQLQGLGRLVAENKGHILVTNEPMVAGRYGIPLKDGYLVEENYLIIADENMIITNIYEGVCEADLPNLVRAL